MKTENTLLQWAGWLIGGPFSVVVALLPSIGYAAAWWYIPKTFLPILLLYLLGGVVWVVVQTVTAGVVIMWWRNEPLEGTAPDFQ